MTAFVVLALPCGAPALAQGSEPAPRPKYAFLRQDEDWSKFQGGDDFFDPIKHVALSDDGEIWVSFGGRVESRVESWNDFAFGVGNPAQDDDDIFVLTRALVHADLYFGDSFRIFTEGKTAQATDRDLPGGRRTLDLDTLALQQFFGELPVALGDSSRLRVRVGRMGLSFGRQRLVSPLPWGNTLRTWDGLAVDHFSGAWHTTGFFTSFAPVDKTDFNEHESDQLLFGLYARRVPKGSKSGMELYWLGTTRENVNFNGTMGDNKRHTFGTRLWSPFGDGFDAEAEGAWQTGSVGSNEVHAGFATAELGFKPMGGLWNHRWFLGLDWASGDNTAGGDVRTFDQLFPLGHAYLGYQDFIGRQNIMAVNVGATCAPAERLKLRAAVHSFWLEDRGDALYNAGGGVLRAPGAFSNSRVGQEIDLRADYVFDAHFKTFVGYSHFIPGGAIEDSGRSQDVDFAYVGASYTY